VDIKDWLKEDMEFFDVGLIGGLLARMMLLVDCWVMLDTWDSASLITETLRKLKREHGSVQV
jgi:hypothetical protein